MTHLIQWSNTSRTTSTFRYAVKLYRMYLTINVTQFNTLLSKATVNGSNIYSADWLGPSVTSAEPWGQMDALEVFKAEAGFAMLAPSTTST